MKYTIITGNPVDGFRALGIFDSNEQAVDYGSMDSAMIRDWSIMEIEEIKIEKKLTHKEMVKLLIEDDIHEWNKSGSMPEHIKDILSEGFCGYSNESEKELTDELKQRGLL